MIRFFAHRPTRGRRVGKAKRAHHRRRPVGTARSLSSGRPNESGLWPARWQAPAGPVGAFAPPALIVLGLIAPAFGQAAPPAAAPARQHISIGYVEIEG